MRELIPKIALAYEAVKNGYRVYLTTRRSAVQLAENANGCVILHKSTWGDLVPTLHRMNHYVCVLDEEAGIAIPRSLRRTYAATRYRTVKSGQYTNFFTISREYKEIIERLPGFEFTKVIASGWPRIDCWLNGNAEFFEEEIGAIKQDFGGYYLFISSFGGTRWSHFEAALNKPSNKNKEEVILDKWRRLQKNVTLLKSLASSLPARKKLVIRPHPSETVTDWKAFFPERSNVHVRRDGDISPWLYASDGVINGGSTAAVQAELYGIPTVICEYEEKLGVTDSAIFEVSRPVESAAEVLEVFEKMADSDSIENQKRISEAIAQEVIVPDRQFAVARIIDSIDDLGARCIEPINKSVIQHGADRIRDSINHRIRGRAFHDVYSSENKLNEVTVNSVLNKMCSARFARSRFTVSAPSKGVIMIDGK